MWDYVLQNPAEVIRGLTRVPAVNLALAAVITVGILWRRRRGGQGVGADRREERVLALAAFGVLLVYVVEYVLRGFVLDLVNIVEWWQYATPVVAAVVALAAVLITLLHGPVPERPMSPSSRRTWLTFSSRAGLGAACGSFLGLVAVTVAAGSASSADTDGRFILLDLVAPNAAMDAVQPWFYGWSFGVPVLIALAALAVVTAMALRANAARPFLRPETVLAEQASRRIVAAAVVRIATAGILLSLAGALRFVERAGTIGTVTFADTGRSYETPWQWAEFAVIGGWLSPVLDVVAFVSLLLFAARLVPSPTRRSSLLRTEVRAVR
ncbi:hypothetical protein HQQ81_06160 [Microbacteriaceae bacterium VKM Ac-2854]|nr:hypothetical protein [Microbacteriaceae bacterium VKM Ac-2854]